MNQKLAVLPLTLLPIHKNACVIHVPEPGETWTRKFFLMVVLAWALFSLNGCMGVGMAAKSAFGDRELPPAERIAVAQSNVITEAHGGSPGVPIAWSDEKSGIQGVFVMDPAAGAPEGCHRFQQTIILAGEALQGQAVACVQKNGSWKVGEEKSIAKQ